ncbi:Hypothetical predicted protein [Mytilus galloprovincialis]|uniref:Uncharacterized protein n=1 Tax=Mytilus galloprovincialis TaxID=29158 RepID=A0A8B6G174_MYTGA|nr:Hypothetical predicted protein [Mytilus galloprovincialis]
MFKTKDRCDQSLEKDVPRARYVDYFVKGLDCKPYNVDDRIQLAEDEPSTGPKITDTTSMGPLPPTKYLHENLLNKTQQTNNYNYQWKPTPSINNYIDQWNSTQP